MSEGRLQVKPVEEPRPGSGYTGVQAGQPVMALASGVAAIAFMFLFVYGWMANGLVYVGWLLRGRPGEWEAFGLEALAFRYPEGLAGSFLALGVSIPLAFLMMRFVHHRRPVWLSSVQPGFRWRYLIVVALVSVLVLNASYWLTTGRVSFVWNPGPGVWLWLVLIVFLAPLQAAGEEYLFRGYLMQVVGSVVRQPWLVVGASGVVFAAVHGEQNVPLFVDRLAFGCLMGALVVVTGGLEAAVAAHAVNNVFAFGYAALSGDMGAARNLAEVSWAVAGVNILAYLVIGVVAWRVGVWMKVAVTVA